MIVCSCHGITDRQIRAAFEPETPRHCPAGSGCGGCIATVSAIRDQVRRECGHRANDSSGTNESGCSPSTDRR